MSVETFMPVQPLEQPFLEYEATAYVGAHRAAEEEAQQESWRSRLGQIAGRAALVLGLAAGGTVALNIEAQPAEAKTQGTCVKLPI